MMINNNIERDFFKSILRKDFKSFVQKVFKEVSPNSIYLDNWHIDVICNELMDVFEDKQNRLIINIPPRYMKSIICSTAFPAFILGCNPEASIIAVSYADELASKLALDCKKVIESSWYQDIFPGTKLSKNKKSTNDFETTKGGGRYATSVGGTLTITEEGLAFCNKLFEIERQLRDVTSIERYESRLKKSVPVLNNFKDWLKYQKPRVLPKSLLGKAIKYCLNQWDKLTGFLLDGRLEIDKNRSEWSIKPFVIGRKNWLFSNTPKGADSSATIYSIVETAKENALNPFNYLVYLLDKLPNIDINNKNILDELMPWSATLPKECMLKS